MNTRKLVPFARLSDDELVCLARDHNQKAMATLINRFHDFALGFAYSKLRNYPDAEDAVQNTWMRVLTRLDQFRGSAKFSTWLCSIILNECRQLHKRVRSSRETSLDAEMEDGHWRKLRSAMTVQVDLDDEERRKWLRENIGLLPAAYRRILLLRYVKEIPLCEVAEMLELSKPAAKSRTTRAQAALRARLQFPAHRAA